MLCVCVCYMIVVLCICVSVRVFDCLSVEGVNVNVCVSDCVSCVRCFDVVCAMC